MLIINICDEITLMAIFYFSLSKRSCCISVELLPVVEFPAKGLKGFVPCECDKSACILRSTKCHLSLQLHPFCCLFFYCVALIEKKKKIECMKKGNDAIRAITLHLRENTPHIILKGTRTSWKVIGHLLLKYSGISH